MDQSQISVDQKKLLLEPNLLDYQWAYRHPEAMSFAKDQTVNAASLALERLAVGSTRDTIALYHLDEKLNPTTLTFGELNRESNRFGNYLLTLGVTPGDRVFFFLPRTPLLYYGFLGAVKIGAIAGTLFSAFGPQALLDRLGDSSAKVLVTNAALYPRIKEIRNKLPQLQTVVVSDELDDHLSQSSDELISLPMHPADPAFMLYTSGTTGTPKGVVHTHQSSLYHQKTSQWVLDLKPDDIYWCTADPGWVTGIVYGMLGPLSNGVTTVVYEGRFDPEVWYRIIQDRRVSVWYSAPTAIRMLEAAGDALVRRHNFSSLRFIASVGEPLNPEPLLWAFRQLGHPFHDTWWQTETGGIMVANFPSLPIRPGSMGKPVPGITATIVDDVGNELPPMKEGNLALKKGWLSMMKEIWKKPEKYNSYFLKGSDLVEWYISGDRAYRDRDGYFWFIGRADDVIKTSGERVGPFEVESALVSHPAIVEAGVIGKPDQLRGEIIKAFVVLKSDKSKEIQAKENEEKLKNDIVEYVKKHLAGHAYPREIEFVDTLPKTRSGKIMRRMLRAKEMGLPVGDTSTLEEF